MTNCNVVEEVEEADFLDRHLLKRFSLWLLGESECVYLAYSSSPYRLWSPLPLLSDHSIFSKV